MSSPQTQPQQQQYAPASALPGKSKPPLKTGQRFNKACDSCHVSKVRCTPDPQSPNGTCKRCTKNGTPCTYSPVGPRRRPVRTKNDRIAELERRVRDMQLKLEREVEKRSSGAASSRPDDAQGPLSGHGKASVSRLRSFSDPDSESGSSGSTTAAAPSATGSDHQPSRHSSESLRVTKSSTSAAGPSCVVSSSPSRIVHTQVDAAVPKKLLPSASSTREADVIDRGLVTHAQADQLLREFRLHIAGNVFGACLPDESPSEQLRRERPAFWLSVLGAASAGSTELHSLSPVLFEELKKVIDLGMNSTSAEPDLDILQAYMNYIGFYYDHVCSTGNRVLEICDKAVTVSVQMAETSAALHIPGDCTISEGDVTTKDVQLSRELLRWYWASISLLVKNRQVRNRRATVLRLIHFVNPCVRVLRTTHAHEDMHLIQWTKLVQITAETIIALHRVHTREVGGLTDEARDAILDSFETRRRQWLVECPFNLVNEIIMLEYHYYVLLVSEFIYPAGFADFNRRSQGLPVLSATKMNNSAPSPDQNFFAPYKIHYTRKCIRAAQSCLDVVTIHTESNHFSSTTPPDVFRRLGAFPYGRIFYALRFLLLVAHEVYRTKKYNIIDIEALRVESYISSLKRGLEAGAAGGSYRYPSLWLYALTSRIEPWYRELKVLLEKDRPAPEARPPPNSEPSGLCAAAGTSLEKVGTEAEPGQFPPNTDESWFNGPMSPLLLELPFEVFSSPDAYIVPPPPPAVSDPFNNVFGMVEPPSFTSSSISSHKDPRGYQPAQLSTYSDKQHHMQAGIGQADPAGGLDARLENMDLDLLDDFDWDSFSEVLTGSDTFISQDPSLVPASNESYQQRAPSTQGQDVNGGVGVGNS